MTVYISIYAAIVATAALAWNIVTVIRNRQGRVKISVNLNYAFDAYGGTGKITGQRTVIGIKLTNKSENSRTVTEPYIEFKQSIGNKGRFMQFTPIDMIGTYPKELKRGDTFSYSVDVISLIEDVFPHTTDENEFRFLIRDTMDVIYKSNYLSVKDTKVMHKVTSH
ncbi:MAG: hypothetical protein F9K23_08500 [Bacteroidetes bacterium]|nr:MAG: hypothetical protein F9K23_08500 [Bacteroidota bacterium]